MEVTTDVAFRKTLVEMLLTEQLHPSPGGRRNELIELAAELHASPPFAFGAARALRRRQRLHRLRPECVHSLRPLRPLHATRSRGCGALTLAGRGDAHADRADARPLLARHRVRALRRLHLRLPDRRALREAGRRGSPSARCEKVRTTCGYCGVGCQLEVNVDPRTGRIAKVTSDPAFEPNRRRPLRQGPLRLVVRPRSRPPDDPARPRRGRRVARCYLGGGAGDGRPRARRRPRTPWPEGGRRDLVGAAHRRGELPDPEARARR